MIGPPSVKALKRRLLLIAVLLFLTAGEGPSIAAQSPYRNGGPQGLGFIIHTAKPYDDVVGSIRALGGSVSVRYQNADAIAARVPAGAVGRLLALPAVVAIEKDYIVELRPPIGEDYQTGSFPAGNRQLLGPAALAGKIGELPQSIDSYVNIVTGASETWPETGAGAGSITAVIDTGTEAGHPCLSGRETGGLNTTRVIAGPDFSPDAGTSFEGSTAPTNNFHGTFVAGVIASRCFMVLDRRVPSDANLASIFSAHLPPNAFFTAGELVLLPLVGLAPESSIYAVKVFPHTGSGVASSIIEEALDHVITKKKQFNAGLPGGLDIDVVNMSLGGAAFFDGRTLEDQLVDAATQAGMVVVAAAGNEGPAPVSVSEPGTAFTALTAGAASDPVHTRIFWDFFFGSGQGLAMYPDDEFRPADFSGRGPLADGRASPDVLATGVFNLSLMPGGMSGFASGTSFSTPAVAGGVALLMAWAQANAPEIGPLAIRNAVIDGATPLPGGWKRRSQGAGYLNVAASLELLKSGRASNRLVQTQPDEALPNAFFTGGAFTATIPSLGPGRTEDLVFEIEAGTSMVVIDLTGVTIDPNPVPATIPNSIELYVKGAKRGGASYLVYSANILGRSKVVIGDGFVDLSGAVVNPFLEEGPMEPGLMKVTVQGDWTNNGNVGATVTVRRFDDKEPGEPGARILPGDTILVPVEISSGTTEATFELGWAQNWARFPTNDLDMYLCAPGYVLHPDFSGATINSPERIIVTNPAEGTWYAVVQGFGVFTQEDAFYLDVKTSAPAESRPGLPAGQTVVHRRIGASHNPLGHDESIFKGGPCS